MYDEAGDLFHDGRVPGDSPVPKLPGKYEMDVGVSVFLDSKRFLERRYPIAFVLEVQHLGVYGCKGAAKGIPRKMMAADLLAIIIHPLDGFGREVKHAAEGAERRGRLYGRGDKGETGHLVVRAAFQQKGEGQTTERMPYIGIKRSVMLLDMTQGLDVVG